MEILQANSPCPRLSRMAPSKVASKRTQASGGKQPGTWTGTCSWRKWTSKRHVIHLLICYTYRYGQSLCFKTVKHRTNGPFNSPRLHVGFIGICICIYIYIFIYLFKYTWLLHLDGSKPTGGELVPFKRSVSSRTAISYSKSLSQGRDVPNGTQDIQSRRNYEKLEVNDLKKVKLWNYEKSENSHFLDHFMMVPWLFLTTVFHHRFYQWWRKNGCNSSLFKCTPQKVDNIILHIYIYPCIIYIYIHSYVP